MYEYLSHIKTEIIFLIILTLKQRCFTKQKQLFSPPNAVHSSFYVNKYSRSPAVMVSSRHCVIGWTPGNPPVTLLYKHRDSECPVPSQVTGEV